MIKIASIVEGYGEVSALPILLRRLANEREPRISVAPTTPIRVSRDKFLNREAEFKRQLLLAAAKCGEMGWILVVLDADDDCPVVLANTIRERANQYIPHRNLSVVIANREYEAWFIASANSLNGVRDFTYTISDQTSAEIPRDAKGWMQRHMGGRSYSEVLDQPAFTAKMDLDLAIERSRSFRKLCKEWDQNTAWALDELSMD